MINKINKLLSHKYSYEIYCLIICIISVITWALLPNTGMILLMAVGCLLLFTTNDPKMIIPIALNLIFTIGTNFNSNDIPYGIIVGGSLLVISLVFYLVRNKRTFVKGLFFYPFLGFAVLNIISIFWTAIDGTHHNVSMYLMYFNWTLYLVVYLIIVNMVNKDIKKPFSIGISYMAILIAVEAIIKGIKVSDQFSNFFDIYFSLGWGICNEAGIMMCVALPFIFYNLLIGDYKDRIINVIKFVVIIVGILITTSRATYLIALCEILLLVSYLIYKAKYRKQMIIGIASTIILTCLLFICLGVFDDMMKYVFETGLDLNGRDSLYQKAISHFTKSPLTVIFGDGIVNEFEFVASDLDAEFEIGTYRLIVYHSTIFQTLAANGILGMGLLIWHFFQKYKLILKNKCSYTILLLIGFICVDLYGMLDNTYHMYYYMIILVIILGVSEQSFKAEREII